MTKFNLMGSFKMLVGLMSLFGTYKMVTVLWLLIFGVTSNIAMGGSIAVSGGNATTGINNTINNVSTGYSTSITTFLTVDSLIIGLIALAVILTLFWPMISPYMPSKKKGSGF